MCAESPVLEIERRYRATEERQREIAAALLANGFTENMTVEQTDIYFTSQHRDLIATEECVRIRATDSMAEITWKPPTSEDMRHSSDFWKQEVDLPIAGDTATAVQLLQCLDFVQYVTVRKKRRTFAKRGVEVGVDDVDHAGTFVEIEVKSKNVASAQRKIDEVARLLGMKEEDLNTTPYRDLVKSRIDGSA